MTAPHALPERTLAAMLREMGQLDGRDFERAAVTVPCAALAAYCDAADALRAIISTEDVYSGLSPREFVRTRVSGITIGPEADAAWRAYDAALLALRAALGEPNAAQREE